VWHRMDVAAVTYHCQLDPIPFGNCCNGPVLKQFSNDPWCHGRWKPGGSPIPGWSTNQKLISLADSQSARHRLDTTATGSLQGSFRDLSHMVVEESRRRLRVAASQSTLYYFDKTMSTSLLLIYYDTVTASRS